MDRVVFEAKISDVKETTNPLFSVCKVYVMYTGKNRNGSYISKDTVESAIPTIFNIPIIGEFKEAVNDFGGHGGKIEISDEGTKFIVTTKPYGVVPSDVEWSWETVDNHEYLVLDGCYLWTGRYDEANSVIENGKGQSMEIEIVDGGFDKKQKVFVIKEMVFSALCILGDDVEPCFEDAKVVSYSLNDASFKAEFEQLQLAVASFSNADSGNPEKGEIALKKNRKLPEGFSLSSEQLEEELKRILSNEATFQDDWWGIDWPKYSFRDYTMDTNVVIACDCENNYFMGFNFTVNGDAVTIDFASGKRYRIEWVEMALPTDNAEDSNFDDDDFSLFNPVGDEMVRQVVQSRTADFEAKLAEEAGKFESVNAELESTKSELIEATSKFTALQEQHDSVVAELEPLKEFKAQVDKDELERIAKEREEAIEALFTSFEGKLSDEEMAPVREKATAGESFESIENELTLMFGRKALASFSLDGNAKPKTPKVPVFDNTHPEDKDLVTSNKTWANIVLEYRNKIRK